MPGFMEEGEAILSELQELAAQQPESDRTELNWGISQMQAKLAEDQRLKDSVLQKHLSVVADPRRCALEFALATNYDQVKPIILERLIKPILKESYVWSDLGIIQTYVPLLKANVAAALTEKGWGAVIPQLFESFAIWGERSCEYFTQQGHTDSAAHHLAFAQAMRIPV